MARTTPTPSTAGTLAPDGARMAARDTSRMRDLHPGWFASVMGTAIVAVGYLFNAVIPS